MNLSDARYNQYETGKRSPDFEILTEIANFYGVTTDYLLSVSDIRNPYEPDTIAAHKDGAEWSDEELEAIENLKEMVRKLRKKEADMTRYRVINIMNNYQIIIDYGMANGAVTGDSIRIIKQGAEVVVPENDDKILGTLDLVKETLEVTIPYEKFSVCEKVKRTTYSVLSPLTNMASGFERKEVHSVKLAVNESQISNLKFPEIEPIQVGDIVEVVGK